MRAAWAVIAGLGLGAGLAWWLARDTPDQALARRQRAEHAAAATAADARSVLYRWRDERGVLQITDRPPRARNAGRKVERVEVQPRAGIEVRGDRD